MQLAGIASDELPADGERVQQPVRAYADLRKDPCGSGRAPVAAPAPASGTASGASRSAQDHRVVGDAQLGCAFSLDREPRRDLDVAVAVEDAVGDVDAPPRPVAG